MVLVDVVEACVVGTAVVAIVSATVLVPTDGVGVVVPLLVAVEADDCVDSTEVAGASVVLVVGPDEILELTGDEEAVLVGKVVVIGTVVLVDVEDECVVAVVELDVDTCSVLVELTDGDGVVVPPP